MSSAYGSNSIPIGKLASATGTSSIALGTYANAANQYSIAIGAGLADSTTSARVTADYGISIGYNSSTIGSYGISIGIGANANTTNAIAIGNAATAGTGVNSGSVVIGGSSTALGYYNVCIGYGIQANSTGSSYNICLGYQSMGLGLANVSNGHNIGIGYRTLYNLDTGAQNICLGLFAGDSITTGTANISMGPNTDVNATSNNQISIGNTAVCSGANAIAIGASITALANTTVLGDANSCLCLGGYATVIESPYTKLQSVTSGTNWNQLYMATFSTSINYPTIKFLKSHTDIIGSFAGAATLTGEALGQIAFYGVRSGGVLPGIGAGIGAYQNGAAGATYTPTDLVFTTSPDGATVPTERFRITKDGNLQIGQVTASYKHIRMGGGNTYGYLWTNYNNPNTGALNSDNIHLSYNYDGVSNTIPNAAGTTTNIRLSYTGLTLLTGATNTAPTTQRWTVNSAGNSFIYGDLAHGYTLYNTAGTIEHGTLGWAAGAGNYINQALAGDLCIRPNDANGLILGFPTASKPYIRLSPTDITITGNLNPASSLIMGPLIANSRLCLYYDTDLTTGFYGFGINAGTLRYQVPGAQVHRFYTGVTNIFSVASTGISKTAGTFDIPHPDPNKPNKRLIHSFVESPTRGDNIYRYKTVVINGKSVIQLPDYWKYLNENPQVWVNPIKCFARCYGEVDELLTKITIYADMDGEFNILLIGTRKDEYARSHFDGNGGVEPNM